MGELRAVIDTLERLSDGSSLAMLCCGTNIQEPENETPRVRVIAYNSSHKSSTTHCLVTNLLEYEKAPAIELASLYHNRSPIEEASDIIKTQHGTGNIELRSKTPDLVRQEFFGLLLATFILRTTALKTLWGKNVKQYDVVDTSIKLVNIESL